MRSYKTALFAIFALSMTAGCGAGPYGFSQTYVPLGEEEDLWDGSDAFTYEAVTSDPADYQGKTIGWFGVVEDVKEVDGKFQIRLSHRKHQERHLCDSDSDRSCRVTVHFKSSGGFSAIVKLRPEDNVPGLDKVQPGSLMRIYGTVRCEENDDEQVECDYDDLGGILLDASYYRQWPARYFVTTRAAASMRR